ncbi:MAG: 16S rRNA (guanine(527)-N(7))-methyltransferase RsmG [Firmicutes bacterium]|nr:16S rRNA (guanine(527)-N(7))-methyltransferase RsmG [Bacillota bacterium]
MANRDPEMLLREGLSRLCGTDDPAVSEKMLLFMDKVLEKNQYMNLTAITDPEDFVVRHFLDSVLLYDTPVFREAETVVDVGTGAGFPGIPLAILCPDKQFLLMDSLNKRILFLEEACRELGLDNVRCLHSRAEDMGQDEEYRERFDMCVSRAVAKLSVLSEYCLPLVRPGGCFVAYKSGMENLSEAKRALKLLGGELTGIRNFPRLPGNLSFIQLDHRLVFIRKRDITPRKYPRKAGTPAKEPL